MLITHQFHQSKIEFPTWSIDYLFLGTFNPENGDKVNYYYGRSKNQMWKLLSKIFNKDFNPSDSNTFFNLVKTHRIGCIDMIQSIETNNQNINKIKGEGYSDSAIINSKTKRTYNTFKIMEVITANPNVKVFSTWGKGPLLKEWVSEISKIPNIIPLVSPSLAARVPKGSNKFDFMLNDWKEKIK